VDESWTYLGLSTLGDEVAVATTRPRWNLTVQGRKPRGEWHMTLLGMRREPRSDLPEWLLRQVAENRGPIGESPRLTALVDVSEYGAGDLLRRSLARALDRYPVLRRRVRPVLLAVTERDVVRSGREDGAVLLSRRDLVAPLLEALEAGRLTAGRNGLTREFREQMDALRRRSAFQGAEEAPEDLVRAAALTAWAIDCEGGGRLRGMGAGEGRISVY